jgi:hypothetical protein
MRTALPALAFALVSLAAAAAPPRITQGRLEPLGGGGALRSRVESVAGPAWVGWSIPARDGRRISCCDNWNGGVACSSCRLDGDNINITGNNDDDLRVANDHHNLFVRVVDHRIEKVRIFSPNCSLDASGATVYWLEAVPPADTVSLMAAVGASGARRAGNNALLALSLIEGGTDSLIDIARHGDHEIRGKALFWLSTQAGEKATAALRDAVEDPDDDIRGKAVFGISQLPDDESIPLLVKLTSHRSRTVRKKAIFWLGQKNDPRALEAIVQILQK